MCLCACSDPSHTGLKGKQNLEIFTIRTSIPQARMEVLHFPYLVFKRGKVVEGWWDGGREKGVWWGGGVMGRGGGEGEAVVGCCTDSGLHE